jgi:hypothetical protein
VILRAGQEGPDEDEPDVLHRFHREGVSIEPSDLQGEGFRFRMSGDYVPVEDRIVPSWAELETIDPVGEEPTVFARVEVRDGVPQVVEIRVLSRPGQREVRQVDLRSIQVGAMIHLLAGFSLQVFNSRRGRKVVERPGPGSEAFEDAVGALIRARRAGATRAVTPQLLERVAEVYRANIRRAPTRAVREAFMVSERTASEYVQRARRAGLLPATTPGRKMA